MRLVTLLLFLVTAFSASASSYLYITNPRQTWTRMPGLLSAPEVAVTPRGAYAEVELTFTIEATTGSFSASDSLEAVLAFDLPAGSVIHDSYLWLTPTVVVRADLIDRGRAVTIYENIVKRRRDPSLLVKTGTDSYQLNVFPMTTAFPRKVKMVYSTPLVWTNGRAACPLPTDLLKASSAKPSCVLTLGTDAQFTTPVLAEMGVAAGGTITLASNQYENLESLHALYTAPLPGGVLLATQPSPSGGGTYQAVIDPVTVLGTPAPRKFTFVLDGSNTAQSIYTQAQMRSALRSMLLTAVRTTDSFNLFYANGAASYKAAPAWVPCDAASVNALFNTLPATIANTGASYETLLKDALLHAKEGGGANSQVILFSNSSTGFTQQTVVDTLYNRLTAAVGAPLPNKIHILNYSTVNQWVSNGGTAGASLVGSELLFSKLALGSSGNHFKYTKATYLYTGGTNTTVYDLNTPAILRELAWSCGTPTLGYTLALPVSNGFLYSRYAVNGTPKLNAALPYVETGRYTGTLSGGNVQLQWIGNGTVLSGAATAPTPYGQATNAQKGWVYRYISALESLNPSGSVAAEIIDSSIHNRVLSSLTAFLALETSDTVKATVNGSTSTGGGAGSGGATGAVPGLDEAAASVRAYPNPFGNDGLTLDFTTAVERVEIYSLSGQLIRQLHPAASDRAVVWNGADGVGAAVPAGIYLIRVHTANGVAVLRVLKR